MKKLIISMLFLLLSTSVFAENVINTQTNTWKSIPITVDAGKHTYTIEKSFLMPEGDYYYTYSGYRCLKNKIEIAGVNPVELNPVNNEGTVIYCYPDK
ncbi:hypothetical protein [Legionella cincinnatiensis]|uniref:Secreted protein n=1 Tax=Legionella cincinnatiensis TaxID=28085 RepID=A0A378IJD5_9GAMM|nr:hypothetical protein [Legionella cincinnatiensis]KTC78774.1 secreted protein [Legionella cincinnatiensis]STX35368.1 secreted protein [Legionella cincinnatiensis]